MATLEPSRGSGVLSVCFFVSLAGFFLSVEGRQHTLELKNDVRNYFALSSFGFYTDGFLDVHLRKFRFSPFNASTVFGFSLDKTSNDAISPYLETHQERCVLEDGKRDLETMSVIFFTLDLEHKLLKISCSETMKSLLIHEHPYDNASRKQRAATHERNDKLSDTFLLRSPRRRRDSEAADPNVENQSGATQAISDLSHADSNGKRNFSGTAKTSKENVVPTVNDISLGTDTIDTGKVVQSSSKETKPKSQPSTEISLTEKKTQSEETNVDIRQQTMDTRCDELKSLPILEKKEGDITFYEVGFIIKIVDVDQEGLYNLYFHNCPNYRHLPLTAVNLTVDIKEMNGDNYLSAGQMPLPAVYFTMSILFFLSGCFWIFILRKSSSADVFKIHYLMALLVYVKSFSLTFHGINFHFIERFGFHMEGWAVLYYITHLLKGALLFITIVLIGTGWALIKHIISDKEKKIFMIVIPLQVLANVAEIIMEESEEGDSSHNAWREVFILVDLLCCGAILFPVVWSIRHLQEASQTDGKAAINLKKLKLFRHFYIMIVCYIYFTRIIVYLLRITVPFKYEWLDEMFREMATLVFFVLTGYKFRPASNNPYLQLPLEDAEIEMDEVLTQSGALDGMSKVTRIKMSESEKPQSKQESSHEYD